MGVANAPWSAEGFHTVRWPLPASPWVLLCSRTLLWGMRDEGSFMLATAEDTCINSIAWFTSKDGKFVPHDKSSVLLGIDQRCIFAPYPLG